MNTNGRVRAKEPDVATSFSDLTHDVIELAELQAKLLALDVKNTTHKAKTSLILAVIGICMLLGTIPVLLFTIAYLLIEQLEWSHAAGFAVATLLGLLISVGVAATAWVRFKNGVGTLERSGDELRRNIDWIKTSLRNRRQTSPAEQI